MKVSLDPWLRQALFFPRPASKQIDVPEFAHICTTTPNRAHTIRDTLIQLIDSANKHLFICSFLIGGRSVTDALRRAVERLRGHVYVITAVDVRSLRSSLAREPNLTEDVLERERKSFGALTKHGIYVRAAEDCHAKFCIADGQSALVGSANYDPNGLGEPTGTACGELGLRLDGPERTEPLAQLFRHIWKWGCNREALPRPHSYSLQNVSKPKEPPPCLPEGVDSVVWTGFTSTSILNAIQRVIYASRRTLFLGSYSFTAMRKYPELVLGALKTARQHGVEVEFLLRDRWRDLEEIGALLDLGIQVRANHENHAKYAIADGKFGLLFSANFDGEHGLTTGVEAGVWLGQDEAGEVARWHSQMWEEAPQTAEFILTPDQLEARLPWLHLKHPAFLKRAISLRGERKLIERARKIMTGVFVFIHPLDNHSPSSFELAGLDDVVRLKTGERETDIDELSRDDERFCPIAKFMTSKRWTKSIAWLPLGLEIRSQITTSE
jgi:phosphatidylserine/phosphatidylglycerophosphate/cardiolipin synthase-like enzyme